MVFFFRKKTKFGGEKKTKKKLSFFFGFFSHMDGPKIEFFLKKKNQIQILFFFSQKKNQISDLVFFSEKKSKFEGEKKTRKKFSKLKFGFFHMDGPIRSVHVRKKTEKKT